MCMPITKSWTAPTSRDDPCAPVDTAPTIVCPLLLPDVFKERCLPNNSWLSSQTAAPHCANKSFFISPVYAGTILSSDISKVVLSCLVSIIMPSFAVAILLHDQPAPSERY